MHLWPNLKSDVTQALTALNNELPKNKMVHLKSTGKTEYAFHPMIRFQSRRTSRLSRRNSKTVANDQFTGRAQKPIYGLILRPDFPASPLGND